jgi:nucleotide-binding universal stress UspA family protein
MSARTEQQPIVLVALDGSFAAATALPIATAVARQLGADCQALHIIADAGPGTSLRQSFAQGLERFTGVRLWPDVIEPTVRLWQVFATPANAIMEAFWHIGVRLDAGDPVAGILRASADPTVVLVVLTTHGRIVEEGRSLGRVAEQVIAQATRPILLIRPEAASPKYDRPLRRLLLPLDGTPTTAALLNPACELASQLGAAIDLLYVAGPGQELPDEPGSIAAPRYVDQPQHEWPHWANEVISRFGAASAKCSPDVPIRTFLVQGDIGEEIAHFAAEHHSDAVVLARRSHLEPGRAGVLRAVLDMTPCPVLLIGEPEAEP